MIAIIFLVIVYPFSMYDALAGSNADPDAALPMTAFMVGLVCLFGYMVHVSRKIRDDFIAHCRNARWVGLLGRALCFLY